MTEDHLTWVSLFPDGEGGVRAFSPWGEGKGAWNLASSPAELPRDLLTKIRIGQGPDSGPLFWLLEPGLPEAWHRHPWGSHFVADRPFAAGALVVREARVSREGQGDGGPRETFWMNRFPRDEHDFDKDLSDRIGKDRLHRWEMRGATAPPATSELTIVAHGDRRGLRDVDLPRHPPHWIWLLACNHEGALDALARELLRRGAATVAVADGVLEAPEIARCLRFRLNHPDRPLEWILPRLPITEVDRSATVSWSLYGEVRLDGGVAIPENARVWNQVHDHSTEPWTPDPEDEACYRCLCDLEADGRLWPATRAALDLDAVLLYLAERWDHRDMRRRMERLQRDRPGALRAQAKAMRRLGWYDGATRRLAEGLAREGLGASDRYRLLALGVSILIDLDLPGAAGEWLRRARPLMPVEGRAVEEFKRLDWEARIAMRQGDPAKARRYLVRKCREAHGARGEDGRRERIALVNFAAWARLGGREAVDTGDWTRDLRPGSGDGPLRGNDTDLYLDHALALEAWATGKTPDRALVERLRRGLEHTDPGPAAQGLLACVLAGADLPSGEIEAAFEDLEVHRYHLEAAVFAALLDAPWEGQGRQALQNLDALRDRALQAFEEEPDYPRLQSEARERRKLEVGLFQRPLQERLRWIVENGLIPV